MYQLTPSIQTALAGFQDISPEQWLAKPNPSKWSKQEILGHLIDSAINNLQRFTEIQHQPKPFAIRDYQQDNLVAANVYQEHNIQAMVNLWLALNDQIGWIMDHQTKDQLSQEIVLTSGSKFNLQWLMEDYVKHLNHHLDQILED